MKKLLVLIIVFAMGTAIADTVNPLPTVKPALEAMLQSSPARKNLSEMKAVANDRNTDIDEANENYIIAKKNVQVARAQFNPITTGHLLGISMGLGYLWAPIAIEAVLSIPSKIHNVHKNKFLAKSAEYNLYDTRQQINNDMAHLYYDILTHEVILKTIDLEMKILTYQEENWKKNKYTPDRLSDQRKYILRLNMERVDIYKMYVSELAAIRTLISTTNATAYELSQVPTELDKSILESVEMDKLENFSVRNSNRYKSSINMHNASVENVKQVKWSLITFAGFGPSYKRNVRQAKNEERIASLQMESVEKEIKTNVVLQASKLDSNIDLFNNYNNVSNESLAIFEDTLQAYDFGQIHEDSVVETALGAIRDYRSKVVAHYIAWASLDDFSNSANYDFSKPVTTEEKALAKNTLELNPLYRLQEDSFTVKSKSGTNLSLYLSSPKIGDVSSVTYSFEDDVIMDKSSDDGKSNYAVYLTPKNLPAVINGSARVTLDNGYEFNVNFSITK